MIDAKIEQAAQKILNRLKAEKIHTSENDPEIFKKIDAMRPLAAHLADQMKILAPKLTANVAMTLFGMGEGAELAQRFILEYCLDLQRQDISQVVLGNIKNVCKQNYALICIGPVNVPEHLITGKGDSRPTLSVEKGQLIEEFLKANKKSLYVDPFLQCLGRSKNELEPLFNYCQKNNITHVVAVRSYHDTPQLVQNARRIKQNAKKLAETFPLLLKPSLNIVSPEEKRDAVSVKALIEHKQRNPAVEYQEIIEQFFKAEKYEVAKEKLERILPRFTDNAKKALCHSTIASCYEKLGQMDEAIEHIQKAIELRKKELGEGHELVQRDQAKLDRFQKSLVGLEFGRLSVLSD